MPDLGHFNLGEKQPTLWNTDVLNVFFMGRLWILSSVTTIHKSSESKSRGLDTS